MSEDRLQRIEDLLVQLIGNVASLRNEFDAFRAEVNQRFDTVEDRVSALEEKQTAIEEGQLEIIKTLQGMDDKFVVVGHRLDFHNARIAKVEEETHLLKTQP
jgi:hypothetical protein